MGVYDNHPWANPDNLGYSTTAIPFAYAPLARVLANGLRIFKGKQAGAISEITAKEGITLTAISDLNCSVGMTTTPITPSFFLLGSAVPREGDQVLQIEYMLKAFIVIPTASIQRDIYDETSWYDDLLFRIFFSADTRLFCWRAQLAGESDFNNRQFLINVPPMARRVAVQDLSNRLQIEKAIVAGVTVELLGSAFNL